VLEFASGETYLRESNGVERANFENRHGSRLVGPFTSPKDAEQFIIRTTWFNGDAS
jgi:hypothetical protein